MKQELQKVAHHTQGHWKLLLAVVVAAITAPFLLKAPAAGARALVRELQAGGGNPQGKAVAARTIWVLFTSQPWCREKIIEDSDGLELWLRLMHLQSPALVDTAADMIYSTVSYQPDLAGSAAVRRLAAATSLPLCFRRCQGSLVLAVSKASPQVDALQQLAASPVLPVLLDFAGLAADSPSARLDAFVSTAAASLLTNMAALPAGRAAMARHPALMEDLIRAMDTSRVFVFEQRQGLGLLKADGNAARITAGRAVQLAANLASDPALAEALSKTGLLDQLLAKLLQHVEQGGTREKVASAMALSNMASASPKARQALIVLDAARLLVGQIASTSSGAVQMATLQAVLSITQGQRWSLPLPQAESTALTVAGQHAVPGQMLQELHGRALAPEARPSGVWTDLQGIMLCGETGTCYSIHHTASADSSLEQVAVSAALADAIQGASCTHIAGRFAAGLRRPSTQQTALQAQTDTLQQVSCYGLQEGRGQESVAWTVSRLDEDWQQIIPPSLNNQSWIKGSWPKSIGSLSAIGSSLSAYQALAAAKLSSAWQNSIWPALQPWLAGAGLAVQQVLGFGRSCGLWVLQALRELGCMLWNGLGLPVVQASQTACWAVWQNGFVPVISHLCAGVAVFFVWLQEGILAPVLDFVMTTLATCLNAVYWAVMQLVGLLLENVVQPVMSAVVGILRFVAYFVYSNILAPAAGVLTLIGVVVGAVVLLLHRLGFQVIPARRIPFTGGPPRWWLYQ